MKSDRKKNEEGNLKISYVVAIIQSALKLRRWFERKIGNVFIILDYDW